MFIILEGTAAPFGGSAGTASAGGDLTSTPGPCGVMECTGVLSGEGASCGDLEGSRILTCKKSILDINY